MSSLWGDPEKRRRIWQTASLWIVFFAVVLFVVLGAFVVYNSVQIHNVVVEHNNDLTQLRANQAQVIREAKAIEAYAQGIQVQLQAICSAIPGCVFP